LSEWDEIGATVARPCVLERAEMPVDTAQLARFLIGKMLVRILAEGVAGGCVVETEAYGIGDPAGHAYRGITPRNRALFLERGHAYVYLAYGSSFMLNVSSETSGLGAGVLIRAIEPTDGITIMERNRGTERVRDLARGPGRLSAALGIDRRLDGIDLWPARCGSDLTVRRRTKSGRANGSALRAQPTVRCDSTFGAMGSSAVRRRSIDESCSRGLARRCDRWIVHMTVTHLRQYSRRL
jgi:DNA-3-methyladenine glycosylase